MKGSNPGNHSSLRSKTTIKRTLNSGLEFERGDQLGKSKQEKLRVLAEKPRMTPVYKEAEDDCTGVINCFILYSRFWGIL